MLGLWLEFLGLLLIIFICSLIMSIAVEKLAARWGANFAGSILLGLVTVLPEYLFVFFAIRNGGLASGPKEQADYYGLALGSVCGAAAMLVTLGYGLVILTATSRFSRKPVEEVALSKTTQIDALYLLATAIVAVILGLIGDGFDMVDAAILTVVYLMYAVHLYFDALKKSQQRRAEGHDEIPVFWALLGMFACGGIVVVVSEPFVDTMKELAVELNVPPIAIAVILSPIASEMPEKLTAFLTVHRDGANAEISVCNFVGSKVNHNSLLLAMMPLVVLIYAGDGFFPGVMVPVFWMMTALTIIATVSLARRRLSHWQGWFFVALFLLQIAVAVRFNEGPTMGH